ncbi:conjugal transfer protein TraR [bacterium]|nr:MAG: conjugal transfer protein TraR [bacterium]
MDKGLQQRFRERLLQEQEHLQTRLTHMEEGAMEMPVQDSISELSMYDNHPADLGSETFERSKDLALRDNTENELRKIDDALQKMAQGTYGRCENCGREIPAERLEAMPATTFCKDCKESEEALPDRHIRPIEEDVIAPPFGGFMHDSSPKELGESEDDNMFDGEDSWQAVARYGTAESPQDIGNVVDYNHMYIDFDEDQGPVEDVEQIPYEKNVDGMIYQDFDGEDDETVHKREKKGYQRNSVD